MTPLSVVSASQTAALRAAQYIAGAKAEASRRAYQSDWLHFEAWCESNWLTALPAQPEVVAMYLGAFAERLRPATLTRRLAAINHVHRAAGHAMPGRTQHFAVGETMKGILRACGSPQRRKKPLFVEEMQLILSKLPEGLRGQRDRALLLMGFAGGLRRSELAGLRVEDLEETPEGLVLTLQRSKTDPGGEGREVALPYGINAETCPVAACRVWLREAGISTGALFRNIDRRGRVGKALHKDSIGLVVKRAVAGAGLDPRLYAGHSLRAGFCTQAYINGARELDIMRQTGHRSLESMRRYIRGRGIFHDNAAAKLGL